MLSKSGSSLQFPRTYNLNLSINFVFYLFCFLLIVFVILDFTDIIHSLKFPFSILFTVTVSFLQQNKTEHAFKMSQVIDNINIITKTTNLLQKKNSNETSKTKLSN